MQPSDRNSNTGEQNSQAVKHANDTRAANKRVDEPKDEDNNDVEKDEHPVFFPMRPPTELRIFLQHRKIPTHTLLLSSFSFLIRPDDFGVKLSPNARTERRPWKSQRGTSEPTGGTHWNPPGRKSLNGKEAGRDKGKSEKQSRISVALKGFFIWLLPFEGKEFPCAQTLR
jgi:hypothetical protein